MPVRGLHGEGDAHVQRQEEVRDLHVIAAAVVDTLQIQIAYLGTLKGIFCRRCLYGSLGIGMSVGNVRNVHVARMYGIKYVV